MAAQAAVPSPREAFQRVETLLAQGHAFTAEEFAGLPTLRAQLADSGDGDLAADLDLVQVAAVTASRIAESQGQAELSLVDDEDQWATRDRFSRERPFWKGLRDASLGVLTAATVATLLLAVVDERNDATLSSGFFTADEASRRKGFNDAMHWALAGTGATMFLSLFPLLWGEARQ